LDVRGRKWREAGEDCIMRSFITSPNIFKGNQIMEDVIGGSCSTYGRDEKCYNILAGNPEDKTPLSIT
jgi:hypothetical protein